MHCHRNSHMIALADFFCAQGFVTVNVETRRGGRFGWRQSASDVCAAIRQTGQVTQLLAADLSRVVIIGHSSGAHLAHCALALHADVLRAFGVAVRGLVSLAGVLDLETACRLDLGGGAVRQATRRATELR
jgi:acetyl esterase/lipase